MEKVDGIHDEKALCDFISKESDIKFSFDELQYKIYVVEDYSETESILVYKFNHALGDGLGLLNLLMNVQDGGLKEDQQIPMKSFTFCTWVKMYMLWLCGAVELGKYMKTWTGSSPLTWKEGEEPHTGKKQCAMTSSISLTKLKAKCKEHNVTLNDMMMAVTAKAFKQYFLTLDSYDETKHLAIAVAVSVRSIRGGLDNQFSMLPLHMALPEQMNTPVLEKMQENKAVIDKFKKLPVFAVTEVVARIQSTILPLSVWNKRLTAGVKKFAAAYANIPGPKYPITLRSGQQSKWITFAQPAMAIPGIGIITHGDIFRINVYADSGFIENPQLVIDAYERCFHELFEETTS